MMRLEPDTIQAIAEAAIKGVVDGGDGLAEVAIETLLGADDPYNVYEFVMLVAGVARRTLAPSAPYVYTGLTLGHPMPRHDDQADDVVLTVLSRAFSYHADQGKAIADPEGVQLALDDGVRRGNLPTVLLRLAAVAAGLGQLHELA